MRIKMQAGLVPGELALRAFDTVVVGDDLVERGSAAIKLASSLAPSTHLMRYVPESLSVEFDGCRMEVQEFIQVLVALEGSSVLLEATTLGFPEILLCCNAMRVKSDCVLGIVYVEPDSYKRQSRAVKVIHQRDFELSDVIVGYRPIPGAIASLDQVPVDDEVGAQDVIFLLGFEGERIDRAIEDLPIDPRRCDIVFGVPGFQVGWETDSFANNIRVLREADFGREPRFCAADNPLAAFEVLEEIYRSLPEGSQIYVAPIGTKPHGIGAALFVCERQNVGVLYDHPKRKAGRTTGTGRWHFYLVDLL